MKSIAQNKPAHSKRENASSAAPKIHGIYIKSMLETKVYLNITEVGGNIKDNLEKKISSNTEGRCIVEGYIKPKSVAIKNYSSGKVVGDNIEFSVVYECMIAHPVEDMIIECTTKTITKAGIHAQVVEMIDMKENIPITIFIARDHHMANPVFMSIKENQQILVRVIGIRYEINDPYICVIGILDDRLIAPVAQGARKKPAIKIHEEDDK
jgi:DNA-directed RNA polymerase subunit E'/Rpb7